MIDMIDIIIDRYIDSTSIPVDIIDSTSIPVDIIDSTSILVDIIH